MAITNYETIALAKLAHGDLQLLSSVDPSLFTGVYSPIFQIVRSFFSENHKLPTMATLEAAVLAKAPKAQLPVVSGILTAIKGVDIENVATKEVVKGLRDKKLLNTLGEKVKELTDATIQKDVDNVRGILSSIVEDTNSGRVSPERFEDAMNAVDTSKIITSGIEGLDEHLTGFAGLTIVSGGSGSGKTAFLLEAAIGQHKEGLNVLFISLELSAQVLGQRLKSSLTGIPFSRIIANDLDEQERKQIEVATGEFFGTDKNFRVVTDMLDSDELLTLIRVEKAIHDIDVVYIDYLNLIGAPAGSEGGWRNLSDTAKALHRLSMELGVVSVSASQVDLEKSPKGNSMPQIRTRGSAELLFSATLLIFLYKPEAVEEDDNTVILYVLKNRNNKQTRLLMEADFSLMRYNFVMAL